MTRLNSLMITVAIWLPDHVFQPLEQLKELLEARFCRYHHHLVEQYEHISIKYTKDCENLIKPMLMALRFAPLWSSSDVFQNKTFCLFHFQIARMNTSDEFNLLCCVLWWFVYGSNPNYSRIFTGTESIWFPHYHWSYPEKYEWIHHLNWIWINKKEARLFKPTCLFYKACCIFHTVLSFLRSHISTRFASYRNIWHRHHIWLLKWSYVGGLNQIGEFTTKSHMTDMWYDLRRGLLKINTLIYTFVKTIIFYKNKLKFAEAIQRWYL